MKIAILNKKIFNVGKTALYWKKMSSWIFIAREKFMPRFRCQRQGWLSCQRLIQLMTDLKPMLIYHSEMLGPLRIMLNLLFLCSVSGTTKPGWQHLFITQFTEYFKPIVEAHCSGKKKKKDSFLKILVLTDNGYHSPRALM